jgi:integrase
LVTVSRFLRGEKIMAKRLMPPRGFFREGVKSPWGVRIPLGKGKYRFEFYALRAERDKQLRAYGESFKTGGLALLSVSPCEIEEFKRFKESVGSASLSEVRDVWNAHHARRQTLQVRDAVEEYLNVRLRVGASAGRFPFEVAFEEFLGLLPSGVVFLGDLTRGGLQGYVDGLQGQRLAGGGFYSAGTVIRRWKAVRAFLQWCVDTERLSCLPSGKVVLPKLLREEVEFMPVADGQRLFSVNAKVDADICAMLALGAFAGLRVSSVLRLVASDVRRGVGAILLPAAKVKPGRRHLETPVPENLWGWVERASGSIFGMSEGEYYSRRDAAARRAGVSFSANWGRHSFVTYYSAIRSVEAAGNVVGHANSAITWAHYKGNATEAEGKEWFGIVPP